MRLQYLYRIKSLYYRGILKTCGRNLRVYGHVNIKNPHNISLGDAVSLNDNVYLNGQFGIEVGNSVALSAGCMVISTSLDKDVLFNGARDHIGEKIVIGDNVQIGAAAIILPGVHIGNNVIIGAGSVVTRDIPSNCVAYGIPARPARQS